MKKKNSKKEKMPKIIKVLLIVLLCIGVAFAAGLLFVMSKFSNMQRESVEPEVQVAEESVQESKRADRPQDSGVMNIMLVGVDNDNLSGMNELGNADGLILLSINKGTKKILLTSFMRDMSLRYDEFTMNKATLIYHDYGMEKLLTALEDNFNIDIDNYVMVNYLNVIEIIDAVGGIDLEISSLEIEGMMGKIENLNELTGDPYGTDRIDPEDEGIHHLNGKQVAAYLRIRNTGDNDQGRTARARKIVSSLKDKAKEMSIFELNNLSNVVTRNITTDLSSSQLLGLLLKAPTYISYEFETSRIPVDDGYTSDESYIYVDFEKNIKVLHNSIYGED